jgi:hypothetical protein
MGFMDYAFEPRKVIKRVFSLTRAKAFFSFPVDGGVLGWQRKLRYKDRCDLFMYRRKQIDDLFRYTHFGEFEVERISRDFFVTASRYTCENHSG